MISSMQQGSNIKEQRFAFQIIFYMKIRGERNAKFKTNASSIYV